jgi:hypothetical protein
MRAYISACGPQNEIQMSRWQLFVHRMLAEQVLLSQQAAQRRPERKTARIPAAVPPDPLHDPDPAISVPTTPRAVLRSREAGDERMLRASMDSDVCDSFQSWLQEVLRIHEVPVLLMLASDARTQMRGHWKGPFPMRQWGHR